MTDVNVKALFEKLGKEFGDIAFDLESKRRQQAFIGNHKVAGVYETLSASFDSLKQCVLEASQGTRSASAEPVSAMIGSESEGPV